MITKFSLVCLSLHYCICLNKDFIGSFQMCPREDIECQCSKTQESKLADLEEKIASDIKSQCSKLQEVTSGLESELESKLQRVTSGLESKLAALEEKLDVVLMNLGKKKNEK